MCRGHVIKSPPRPKAKLVTFNDYEVIIHLVDDRKLHVPLSWFSPLMWAELEVMHDYELIGDGEGIRWDSLDYDVSVPSLLLGFKPNQNITE